MIFLLFCTAVNEKSTTFIVLFVTNWGLEPQTPCLKGRCSTC